MSAILTSGVLASSESQGKSYRSDTPDDTRAFAAAAERLAAVEQTHEGDLSLVPDEPMPRHLTGGVITAFGFDTFGKLFNDRQLLAMTTFARLVGEAHSQMRERGMEEEYAKAVATYLGLAVDRQATRTSAGSFWDAGGGTVQQLLARQALPMVWDYA